jgi:hypothetical protein
MTDLERLSEILVSIMLFCEQVLRSGFKQNQQGISINMQLIYKWDNSFTDKKPAVLFNEPTRCKPWMIQSDINLVT